MNPKQIMEKESRYVGGHRACSGCPMPSMMKQILSAVDNVVVANATSCLEVTSTVYPFTSWKVPWIHSLFENAPATISGVERAYKSMKKKGLIDKEIKFMAIGGDGGSYDIGLQSLSGALERGHDFVYVAYDNQGYMNTGNQRSSATPLGANTTTTPVGKLSSGKMQVRKNLTEICVAHRIPYVAQTAVHAYWDLTEKMKKAFANTPSVVVILSPCVVNWGISPDMTMQISKLAAETCYWPMYDVENGKYKINFKPSEKKPIEEFLKNQSRFKHLLKEDKKSLVEEIQNHVDNEWERLLKLESCSQ
jgi:pyruvate ferredoxin oxidoreductase beta subunit